MKKTTYKAYAKINLTLDVLGRLDNGYHSVKMIMQTVSLYDAVTVELTNEKKIEVSSNLAYLPNDNGNLAYKAVETFSEKTGYSGGVKITLDKHIPVGAGLAGGSSDCAAVLNALNKLCNAELSSRALCEIGASLGADVPYCLLGGTRLAEGIGEKLSLLPKLPYCHILLVKPAFSISTKSVYEKIDACSDYPRPDTRLAITGLRRRRLDLVAKGMGNVLEEVSVADYPVLEEVKSELLSFGALAAQMSGSGPTMFGIFSSRRKAEAAKQSLWGRYKTVYLCYPV